MIDKYFIGIVRVRVRVSIYLVRMDNMYSAWQHKLIIYIAPMAWRNELYSVHGEVDSSFI